jgi:hypothetical protein
MNEQELREEALKKLRRAAQEAGRALPGSWVAEGDPDLESLRTTADWKKLMRRMSTMDDDRVAPLSAEVAMKAHVFAQLVTLDDANAMRARVAERLGDGPDDTVSPPETPARPVGVRLAVWGPIAAVLVAVAIYLLDTVKWDWYVEVAVVGALLALGAAAGYRVYVATWAERWRRH